jgi:prepilin-type N-terminal cleavage/methylation domain-containing protein
MTMTSATGNDRSVCRAGTGAFTLIELSIVVFIMAVIMAVSVPYFARFYNESQSSQAARSLVTLCQQARYQAVLGQQSTTLQVDMDTQRLWITYQARDEKTDAEQPELTVISIPRQVRIASVERLDEPLYQRGKAAITFYPNGTCDWASIALRGSDKRAGADIVLDPVTARATPYPAK